MGLGHHLRNEPAVREEEPRYHARFKGPSTRSCHQACWQLPGRACKADQSARGDAPKDRQSHRRTPSLPPTQAPAAPRKRAGFQGQADDERCPKSEPPDAAIGAITEPTEGMWRMATIRRRGTGRPV